MILHKLTQQMTAIAVENGYRAPVMVLQARDDTEAAVLTNPMIADRPQLTMVLLTHDAGEQILWSGLTIYASYRCPESGQRRLSQLFHKSLLSEHLTTPDRLVELAVNKLPVAAEYALLSWNEDSKWDDADLATVLDCYSSPFASRDAYLRACRTVHVTAFTDQQLESDGTLHRELLGYRRNKPSLLPEYAASLHLGALRYAHLLSAG